MAAMMVAGATGGGGPGGKGAGAKATDDGRRSHEASVNVTTVPAPGRPCREDERVAGGQVCALPLRDAGRMCLHTARLLPASAMWPMTDSARGTQLTQPLPSDALRTGRAGAPCHTHANIDENGTTNTSRVSAMVTNMLLTRLMSESVLNNDVGATSVGASCERALGILTNLDAHPSPALPRPPRLRRSRLFPAPRAPFSVHLSDPSFPLSALPTPPIVINVHSVPLVRSPFALNGFEYSLGMPETHHGGILGDGPCESTNLDGSSAKDSHVTVLSTGLHRSVPGPFLVAVVSCPPALFILVAIPVLVVRPISEPTSQTDWHLLLPVRLGSVGAGTRAGVVVGWLLCGDTAGGGAPGVVVPPGRPPESVRHATQ